RSMLGGYRGIGCGFNQKLQSNRDAVTKSPPTGMPGGRRLVRSRPSADSRRPSEPKALAQEFLPLVRGLRANDLRPSAVRILHRLVRGRLALQHSPQHFVEGGRQLMLIRSAQPDPIVLDAHAKIVAKGGGQALGFNRRKSVTVPPRTRARVELR